MCVCSLAGYVEALASRLGMQVPDLTPKQADMWQTRLSSHTVRLWCFYFEGLGTETGRGLIQDTLLVL